MNPLPVASVEYALFNEKAALGAGAVQSGQLLPILPIHTARYEVKKRVTHCHTTIPAGMYAPPKYTTKQWARIVHPEGKSYFCRNAKLRVVTDAYMDDKPVADKINEWVSRIEDLAAEKDMDFEDKNVELFLELDEDEDCFYYFADHSSRSLFWLEQHDTSELGLAKVASLSHLALLLQESYWLHVERHSMHGIVFDSNIIEEMISLLVNGAGDHLTSNASTFPYTAKECKRFLNLLIPCRDQTSNGLIMSLVARIYAAIANNRYYIHYGEEQARLARNSSILVEEQEEVFWTQPVVSAITLGTSERFHSQLTSIFTDNYVYDYDWRKFVSECLKKWKASFFMSLGLLLLHVFCFHLPVSEALALVSASCLGVSLASSALLIRYLEDQEGGTAADAHAWLKQTRRSFFGFQGPALVFALPQAFNIWGLILLFAQAFTVVEPEYLAYGSASIVFSLVFFKIIKCISYTIFSSRSKVSASVAV